MISMKFDFMPPSANHAYFNLPRGGRTLTNKGKKFKSDVRARVIKDYSQDIVGVKKDHPYGLAIRLCFDSIVNKTWPENASARYKKIDASNRVKLLEDALVDAFGIDDSQFMMLVVEKIESQHEGVVVCVWDYQNEDTGDAIRRVRTL